MSGLLLLVGSMVIFFVAYVTYGSWLCKKWGVDPTRKTPAERLCDNVDYMPTRPAVLMGHHFSSIAGAGPIVGPITAAVFGWVPVMLWILIGSIFFGGVHDFGALYSSIRFDGKTIGQIIDATLGKSGKFLFSIFAYVTLLVVIAAFANIVAATFVASPQAATASLLFIVLAVIFGFSVYRCGLSLGVGTVIGVIMLVVAIAIGNMYPLHLSKNVWVCILMVYIFVASIAPVWILLQPRDYLNSFLLYACIAFALVGIAIYQPSMQLPAFTTFDPSGKGTNPMFPMLFVTVACGAISGFHSTQSPLMARCMKSEKQGHFVFYGAMVCEGVIALIWAAAGCALYTITDGKMAGLAEALAAGQSAAIYDVCLKTMGKVGVALAMIGVVICPITSGDTAFRSARLTLADWFKIDQDSYANRLKLCVPVLGVGAFLGIGNALGFINYTVIWRYFSWTNQTLAMIVLWAASMYLFKEKKNYWITAVPATFMSAVSCTYFVLAPECLGKMINTYADGKLVAYISAVAYPIGIIFAIAMLALFIHATKKHTASQKA